MLGNDDLTVGFFADYELAALNLAVAFDEDFVAEVEVDMLFFEGLKQLRSAEEVAKAREIGVDQVKG